jgi:hypothetical protein
MNQCEMALERHKLVFEQKIIKRQTIALFLVIFGFIGSVFLLISDLADNITLSPAHITSVAIFSALAVLFGPGGIKHMKRHVAPKELAWRKEMSQTFQEEITQYFQIHSTSKPGEIVRTSLVQEDGKLRVLYTGNSMGTLKPALHLPRTWAAFEKAPEWVYFDGETRLPTLHHNVEITTLSAHDKIRLMASFPNAT